MMFSTQRAAWKLSAVDVLPSGLESSQAAWIPAARAVLAAALIVMGSTVAAAQTTLVVNDTSQNGTGCTLGKAIASANALKTGHSAVAPCQHTGTLPPYTIQLPQAGQFTMVTPDNYWYGPNALPPIASEVIIEGN